MKVLLEEIESGGLSTESGAVDFDLIFKNPVIFHGFELILQK